MKSSRWYLTHAVIFWLIALMVGWYGISEGGVRDRANCVSEAIVNAEEWQTKGRKAMIAVSNIREGVDHAQAIGLDSDGYWKFLTRHHSDGILRIWQRHFDVEPYRYIDVQTFIKEQEVVN